MASKRINLLSDIEIDELYGLPAFNSHEQKIYFSLTPVERQILAQYSNTKTRIYFILQLGYFKAKQQFFNFRLDDVLNDVEYIVKTYYRASASITLTGKISGNSIRAQQQAILSFFAYHGWANHFADDVFRHIVDLLRYYPKGHSAFRQLLAYLDHQKIIIPAYSTLQDLFSQAFSVEEKRLYSIIANIAGSINEQLLGLIQNQGTITELNAIRSDQKDFQYTAIKEEVEKANKIKEIYLFSKDFIPTLNISKNAVRYYAEITEQYTASRLRRLTLSQQKLYILCFIHHRYQQIIDNLIVSFCYHTRAIKDAAKTYASIAHMEHSSGVVADFPKLAKFLKWFPNRDNSLSATELNQEAYRILPKDQFEILAEYIDGKSFDKKAAIWEYYGQSSRMFSLYLRPIFTCLSLEYFKDNYLLCDLIKALKSHYLDGKSPSSLKICDDLGITIPKSMIPYLKKSETDSRIDPYLFEFYVYQKVYHELERGRLYCNDSISYCDIDVDLVDDALVDDAERIATEFGYSKIPIYCDQRLDLALEKLDDTWRNVTQRIREGDNAGISIQENSSGERSWHLHYQSSEKRDDSFFKSLPKIEIANLVMFVGEQIGMWDGFSHLKDRYIKRKNPSPQVLNACLLSEAFGFGIRKMADMSDLDYNQLVSVREDFVRVDTLCAANDIVSNYIHSLPIFKAWNLMDEQILADADGQKFPTTDNTIQSRYSRKYLGKGRGISLNTLLANYVAVNAKNIGLNEYEGHSLYDMIYNNKTDIDIQLVTGDNHSLNQLNFVALDSIDVDYVPSIKNIKEAANNLYAVHPLDDEESIIQPNKLVNKQRITSQKRSIIRVLLSLILQENTQSNIIRKLNSHARYSRLKAALFEYNAIFKSIHVLNLIDDMELRKAIRRARNRTEAYHQLQSNIRKTYHGVFQGKRVVENRVSAHAARLVANCIIAYNSIMLNAVYLKMLAAGVSQSMMDKFILISPIAWSHTLLTGRYSFKKSNGHIDMDELSRILEQQIKQHFEES